MKFREWKPLSKKAIAVSTATAVVALMLAACGAGQPGAAAVVGNETISDSKLTAEVEQVVTGLEISPSGEVNRVMLQRMVLERLVDQLATEHDITVSEGEIQALIDKEVQERGSEEAFKTTLLRNGVPEDSVNDAVRMSVQLQKLGEKLAPGKPETEKQMAVSLAAINLAGQEGVEVNPRFGVWDLTSLQIAATPDTISQPAGSTDNGLVQDPIQEDPSQQDPSQQDPAQQ